jgi:hypothetical protein
VTAYVQIVHPQRPFDADDWTPWKNCKNVEEAALLAVHRFVRESGYASPRAEYEPFEVEVFVADDKAPRHKNGRFMACHGYKMKVSKNGH